MISNFQLALSPLDKDLFSEKISIVEVLQDGGDKLCEIGICEGLEEKIFQIHDDLELWSWNLQLHDRFGEYFCVVVDFISDVNSEQSLE